MKGTGCCWRRHIPFCGIGQECCCTGQFSSGRFGMPHSGVFVSRRLRGLLAEHSTQPSVS